MKKKLALINSMKKGKFSQSVTKFSSKSNSVVPVVIDVELVDSLIGNEVDKAPSVAAVNLGLLDKITEEQAKKIAEDIVKNIKIPEQTQADWLQNSITSVDYIKNKPNINNGKGNFSIIEGKNTYAGCYAFKISDVQPRGYSPTVVNMTITIDQTEDISNIAINDVCSIIVNKNYMNFGMITSINYDINAIIVNNYPADLDYITINTALEGNCYFFIAKKPSIGTHLLDIGQHAEGVDTTALLYGAHSEGYRSIAGGRYSHAEGDNTYAGYGAHAEGQNTKAVGNLSHAEGSNTVASGLSSHAEGNTTIASGECAHAEGGRNIASGYRSHAEGDSTTATKDGAHSEGSNTYAHGYASHAEGGGGTKANGDYSHAEGQTCTAEGTAAHVEGAGSTASGKYSHAENDHTSAIGEVSHVEGYYSSTYGPASHAEGRSTKTGIKDNATAGDGAHSEGRYTTASGQAAHAEGNSTVASGAHSHAEGTNSVAEKARSHAEGFHTIARADSQHVQGKYNVVDENKAHIVGAGTSDTARKNIHTIDWSGNGWFAGNIKIGGTTDSEGKEVTTKEYVDGMQIVADIDSSTYVMTISLLNKDNKIIKTTNIDLPLEEMIVDGRASEDGKNIILTLKNGNEVSFSVENIINGLASTAYVDNGLAGKVEKTTKALKVYGTKGVDSDGNVIHDTYDIYFVPTVAGSILQVTDPTNSNFDKKTPTKTAAVCDPQKPTQIANKQWTEKNFVPIHTQYASKLYGTGGSTGNVTQRFYSMSATGTTTGDVVNWLLATNTSFDNKEPACTIGACDPIKPIQVANKRYVDGKVSELEHGVMNALGTQYTFESLIPQGPFIYIPEGALSAAYVETVGKASGYSQGEHKGDFDIISINILNEYLQILSSAAPTADQYIMLPEGATIIEFVSDANGFEEARVDASIKFQVKVGG